MSSQILVVGAGFAGAVYARTLAEAGFRVTVIDRRSHIGGNAYDEIDAATGIRFHRYGPHLFHTKQSDVIDWLSRFTDWIPYEHRVRALLSDGSHVPLPINIETINTIFMQRLEEEDEVKAFLQRISIPNSAPRNAADYLRSCIGDFLTEMLFARYTKKMWNLPLDHMDVSVVKRIPVRFNKDDRYFPDDQFQMLPTGGYTALFQRIFDHPHIKVKLLTPFVKKMKKNFVWTFNSMAIDEYFDGVLGPLPYRSIRFHHYQRPAKQRMDWAVTNFTDTGPTTRETHWYLFPGHDNPEGQLGLVTQEEPCDYRENAMERYYPVKTANGEFIERYKQYRQMAEHEDAISFIGRCGTYQYLDMDQVVKQSLIGAQKWLHQRSAQLPIFGCE